MEMAPVRDVCVCVRERVSVGVPVCVCVWEIYHSFVHICTYVGRVHRYMASFTYLQKRHVYD